MTMDEKRYLTRHVLKNGTTSDWEAEDAAKLLKGEPGIEWIMDENNQMTGVKIKFGDGQSDWKDLPYSGLQMSDIESSLQRDNFTLLDGTGLDQDVANGTDEERLATITTKKQGDIAVVKTLISGDKYSYTAYVYDGENWGAMDGNYNASNVFLSGSFDLAGDWTNVGNIKKSDKTKNVDGMSIQQLFQDMFDQTLQPGNPTSPSIGNVTIRNGSSGNYVNSDLSFEVGTTVTPAYSVTYDDGAYTYTAKTGANATTWTVTNNVTPAGSSTPTVGSINANGQVTATGTFPAITIGDTTSYTITVDVDYQAGNVALDNKGGESNPKKQITAGSVTAKTSKAFKGYRAFFYGGVASPSNGEGAVAIDSTLIRSLNNGGATSSKTLGTYAASSVTNCKRIIVAIPKGANKGVTKVLMPSAANFDATADFKELSSTVNVNDASLANPVEYRVWVYEPASITSDQTFSITIG